MNSGGHLLHELHFQGPSVSFIVELQKENCKMTSNSTNWATQGAQLVEHSA